MILLHQFLSIPKNPAGQEGFLDKEIVEKFTRRLRQLLLCRLFRR